MGKVVKRNNPHPYNGAGIPQYTRPPVFNKWQVPKELLSGHHKKIAEWHRKHQK